MDIMHVFRIVRAKNGWTVQSGCAMTAPCRSHAAAVAQAKRMAEAIRRHGEDVTVIVEPIEPKDGEPVYFVPSPRAAAAARIRAPRRVSRVG
jgi:hypothetical protein